jgi:hypothetical protein
MRRYLSALAVALALVTTAGGAAYDVRTITLLQNYDLDGEAADDDQILAVANGILVDSTDYTASIAAQPDTCRLVDITVTDADSSVTAGVLTALGKGCMGETRSCSFTFAAGGSGVKTLTCTDGEGAYFASVASISTGVLTGEGGAADTVIIGYTSNSVNGWGVYGATTTPGPNAENGVNPFGEFTVPKPITRSRPAPRPTPSRWAPPSSSLRTV